MAPYCTTDFKTDVTEQLHLEWCHRTVTPKLMSPNSVI